MQLKTNHAYLALTDELEVFVVERIEENVLHLSPGPWALMFRKGEFDQEYDEDWSGNFYCWMRADGFYQDREAHGVVFLKDLGDNNLLPNYRMISENEYRTWIESIKE